MFLTSNDLAASTRGRPIRRQAALRRGLAKIRHGVYLNTAAVPPTAKPWEVRIWAAQARILAVHHALSATEEPVFTGESALVALGIDTWWNNPDVACRGKRSRVRARTLVDITVHGTEVPSAQVREIRSSTHHQEEWHVAPLGVRIARYSIVALDLCRHHHPLQAFYDVSMLLRHLSRFDRRDLRNSRLREAEVRRQLLDKLAEMPGQRSVAIARAVVRHADAGIESPGEAVTLWGLRCIVPPWIPIETQLPQATESGSFYLDVALPTHRVGFEPDGAGKFGTNAADARRAANGFLRRQQQLNDLGWQISHITYEQTKNVDNLVGYMRRQLSRARIPTTLPRGALWAAPTLELWARNRRF